MAAHIHNEIVFQKLFETYKNRLYGYVFTITKSAYTAEEITQEIFIKLWLCRDILDQVENPDSYIFKIAKNKTLNHLRKAAYDSKLFNELLQQMAPESNNVEERILIFEYEKLEREALDMLSPQRRLVYQLSRKEGLNHEEIAVRLKLSRNTVKNHLVAALRFIRSYFKKSGSMLLILIAFLLYS